MREPTIEHHTKKGNRMSNEHNAERPCFVLGYDESGRVIFMSHRPRSEEEARTYARTCATGWRAFVVRAVEVPS